MNVEDMMKSMNPQNLQNAIRQMEKVLSPQQLQQVQKAIQQTDKGELNRKLNHLSQADLQQELRKNPALAKQLASNPEIMKKINRIFQGK